MTLPLRIAHRGASGSAPENTLAAFSKALEIGVDLLETDIRATSDGALVLLHDPNVDRTTDGSGPLRNLMLDQVQRLDAGSWFSPSFAGERVPTLQSALSMARGKTPLLLEVKEPELAAPLVEVLQECDALQHVVAQSFDAPTVHRLKQLEPRLSCGLLLKPDPSQPLSSPEEVAQAVLSCHANIAALYAPMLSPALVEYLRIRGLPVWTWTLDDPAHIQQAIAMGVAGIISNHPERI